MSRRPIDWDFKSVRLLATTVLILILGRTPCSFAQSPPRGFDDLEVHVAIAKNQARIGASMPLLIHFHGDATTVETNFHASGLSGALVVINCRGLSSAYRLPFENQSLFPYVVKYANRQLAEDWQLKFHMTWERVDLSCFSAGYGAVREVLKNAKHVARVDAVVAADSIYASIEKRDGVRIVDTTQMQPFVDFARSAAAGKKFFLVSFSQLPIDAYASTSETAGHLLTTLALDQRRCDSPADVSRFAAESIASRQGLTILGYPGDDGAAHLAHLRQIASLWKQLEHWREKTSDDGLSAENTEP